MLDHSQRQNKLKIRGIPEKVGKYVDLPDLISDWLSHELCLNQGFSIVITKAYRIGAKANPRRDGPREIIAALLNVRLKQRILAEVRQKHSFRYKSSQVLIFPDLSREALQKRHELKPITQILLFNNITSRWVTPLKISLRHQGKVYIVENVKAGKELLRTLKIRQHTDEEMPEA